MTRILAAALVSGAFAWGAGAWGGLAGWAAGFGGGAESPQAARPRINAVARMRVMFDFLLNAA